MNFLLMQMTGKLHKTNTKKTSCKAGKEIGECVSSFILEEVSKADQPSAVRARKGMKYNGVERKEKKRKEKKRKGKERKGKERKGNERKGNERK